MLLENGLVELLESDEISELRALSYGLRSMVENCDFIVLDTSFVLTNLFEVSGPPSFEDCMSPYTNNHNNINPFSLIRLYEDISVGKRMGDDLGDIHDEFDQNLLTSDMNLEMLSMLVLEGKAFSTSQSFSELSTHYNVLGGKLRKFKYVFKKMRKIGYTKETFVRDITRTKALAEHRKRFFREQYESYGQEFIKNSVDNSEKLSFLITYLERKNAIVQDTNMFEDADKKIIDGALGLDGNVGIVTCDGQFDEKTRDVIRSREEVGLENPSLRLMVAKKGFKTYQITSY